MPKRRGPPKGNTNARKHGFYSRAFTQAEQCELSQTAIDYRANNIKFFKVLISRTAERIKPSAATPMTFRENAIALQTVVIAVSRLHSAVDQKHQMQFRRESDDEKFYIEGFQRMGMTLEEIERDVFGRIPPSQPALKRGGQPANQNALKHGFFASHFHPEELRRLEDLNEDDVAEEVALIQVLMNRVFIGMHDGAVLLMDYLKAVRVLSYADACLQRLNRTRGSLFTGPAVIAKALDELREELGFEED